MPTARRASIRLFYVLSQGPYQKAPKTEGQENLGLVDSEFELPATTGQSFKMNQLGVDPALTSPR